MTRSVGDFMFKMNLKKKKVSPNMNALSNEPEVKEFSFSKADHSTDIVLMGCDGIWEGTMLHEDETTRPEKDNGSPPEGY